MSGGKLGTRRSPSPTELRRVEGGEITAEELEHELSMSLAGRPDAATIVERRPAPYRSSFPLECLRVRTPEGAEQRLVFKDLSRRGPHDPVWSLRAPFLEDPSREIQTYRRVLMPHGFSTPQLRAAVIDPECGRHWLFLEHVDGDPLWQCGDETAWRRAAEWLAQLHARFSGDTNDLPRSLLRYDGSYYRRWLERAQLFASRLGDSRKRPGDLAWLARRVSSVIRWLDEQPVTLLHGEYCPANVLVERRETSIRIRPIDWEMTAIGSGLLDLAALTSGDWNDAERDTMARAYRNALPVGLRPSDDELSGGLVRCRLLSAVQWIGWSRSWMPPPEQAHDWLATAFELAAAVPTEES